MIALRVYRQSEPAFVRRFIRVLVLISLSLQSLTQEQLARASLLFVRVRLKHTFSTENLRLTKY